MNFGLKTSRDVSNFMTKKQNKGQCYNTKMELEGELCKSARDK
jgi:hypothetical protein